jgi:hypothetical protein
VTVDDERAGWWMASDGNLYPPHLHPDFQVATFKTPAGEASAKSTGRRTLGPNAQFKRLRYGGTCVSCGTQIPRGANGWHDASVSKVSCSNCPPSHSPAGEPGPAQETARSNPVGGTSALGVANSRRDPRWTKGAAGEYLMAKALHEKLPPGTAVLNDRAVPHSQANIDHIVVAPTGVWIIDSKHWKGLIQVKNIGGLLGWDQRLFVDGHDRSSQTEKIYSQVIPVANALADPSIPIRPALVFVDGNWGASAALRHRPYELLGVTIAWPRAIIAKISEAGPLTAEDISRIALQLDQALPPAR